MIKKARTKPRLLWRLVIFGMVALISGAAMIQSASAADITATVSSTAIDSRMLPGMSDIRTSKHEPTAAEKTKMMKFLSANSRLRNTFIMGEGGAQNPEPSKGKYDWTSLDLRISAIKKTDGIPVITLCCAPDWMKGGNPGTTDLKKINNAPNAANYSDFAELSRQIALRYKDVQYFQVWKDFHGMQLRDSKGWDYRNYTTLYNDVYKAIKSANPNAKVGGPYVPIGNNGLDQKAKDALTYWNKHKVGADFVSLSGGIVDPKNQKSQPLKSDDDRITRLQKLIDANKWVRDTAKINLPIWWSEYYLGGDNNGPRLAALDAAFLIGQATNHGGGVLVSEPRSSTTTCQLSACYFTSNGSKLEGYDEQKLFFDNFTPSKFGGAKKIYKVTSSSKFISGIATDTKLLLVNNSGSSKSVTVAGSKYKLSPYQIHLSNRKESNSKEKAVKAPKGNLQDVNNSDKSDRPSDLSSDSDLLNGTKPIKTPIGVPAVEKTTNPTETTTTSKLNCDVDFVPGSSDQLGLKGSCFANGNLDDSTKSPENTTGIHCNVAFTSTDSIDGKRFEITGSCASIPATSKPSFSAHCEADLAFSNPNSLMGIITGSCERSELTQSAPSASASPVLNSPSAITQIATLIPLP